MSGFRYAAGDWWGIAAKGTALLLAPATAPAVVTRMLAVLRSGAPVGGVLGALAEETGGDLLSLPSFALLVPDGAGARLLLRGADASLDGRPASGAGVLTWTEQEVPSGSTVALLAGGDAVAEGLELVDGVVRCAVLVASGDRAAVQEAPAPVVAAPLPDPGPPPAPVAVEQPDLGATLLPPRPEPEPSAAAAPALDAPATRPAPVPVVDPEEQADLTGLNDLLGGHTVVRSVADAARWPDQEQAAPSAPPPSPEQDSDHDGFTMLRSDLEEDDAPSLRTSVGTIRLHDGRTWELDRPVIIGRRPQASRVSAGEVPHLVTVESPTQDISRSHVEIRPEGAHAVVVDLGTTNGTTLRRPGRPPQRLVANDRHVLADQDVVDLGDDVLVTFAAAGAQR